MIVNNDSQLWMTLYYMESICLLVCSKPFFFNGWVRCVLFKIYAKPLNVAAIKLVQNMFQIF